MSVTPSNIAGGFAQSSVQSAQVARQRDAVRNQTLRSSQKMRELIAQHLHAIEDFYETSDDHLIVDEDGQSPQQYTDETLHEAKTSEDSPDVPPADTDDSPILPGQLDLHA